MAQPRTEATRMLSSIHQVAGHPVLPPCVVLGCIGQGGMAVVFRGLHVNLGIDVAIKCMRPSLVERAANYVDRFRREAQSAARINHQNVVRVFDVGEQQGLHYLILELVDGESARERIVRKGPLPVGEAVQILLEAARGLGEAHLQGMVHRDIKPDNLLVARNGQVKVADLGLAKPAAGQGGTQVTGPEGWMGTPQYMPPEQWDGPDVTAAADVWALGATLWYLLVGRHAIPGDESTPRIMSRICSQPFPALPSEVADVPPELAAIVGKATAVAPADRYDNAAELASALEALRLPRVSLRDDGTRGDAAPTLLARPTAKALAAIKDWLRNGAITPDLPSDVDRRPEPIFADDAAAAIADGIATVARRGASGADDVPTRARPGRTEVMTPPVVARPRRSGRIAAILAVAIAAGAAVAALGGAFEPRPIADLSPIVPSTDAPPTDDRAAVRYFAARTPLGAADARAFAAATERLRQAFDRDLQLVAPIAPVEAAGDVPIVLAYPAVAGDRLRIDGAEVVAGPDGRYATTVRCERSRDVEVALLVDAVAATVRRRIRLAPVDVTGLQPAPGQGVSAPLARDGAWLVGDGPVRMLVARTDPTGAPAFTVDGAVAPARADGDAFLVELPLTQVGPCVIAATARRAGDEASGVSASVTVRRVVVDPAWRSPAPGAEGRIPFRSRASAIAVSLGADVVSASVRSAGEPTPLAADPAEPGVFRGELTIDPGVDQVVLRWRDVLDRPGERAFPAGNAALPPVLADVRLVIDGRERPLVAGAEPAPFQSAGELRFAASDAEVVELAVGDAPATAVTSPVALAPLLPADVVVAVRLAARGFGGAGEPAVFRLLLDATPPAVTLAPPRLELAAGQRATVMVDCRDASGIRSVHWSRRGSPQRDAVAPAADGAYRLDVAAPATGVAVDYEVVVEDNAGRTQTRAFVVAPAATVPPTWQPPKGFRRLPDAAVRGDLPTAIAHEATGIVLELCAPAADAPAAPPTFYFAPQLVTRAQFDAADAATLPQLGVSSGETLKEWFNGRGAGLALPELAQRRAIAGRVGRQGAKEWLRPRNWNGSRWPMFEPSTGDEVEMQRLGDTRVGFRVVMVVSPR